jgi:hypothetical protein
MAFSLLALRLGKDRSINLSLRECRHKSGRSGSRLNFSNPSIECNQSVAPLTLAPRCFHGKSLAFPILGDTIGLLVSRALSNEASILMLGHF